MPRQPQLIRLDLFPARVRVVAADGTEVTNLRAARVIVANDGRAVIFQDAGGRRADLVLSASAEKVGREEGRGVGKAWLVELADGTRWEAVRGGGCGCGSPLRRMDPLKALEAVPAP